MKKYILFVLLIASLDSFAQNKLDFGIAIQQNNNRISKWDAGNPYDSANYAFSVIDIQGDTIDINLHKFEMSNNVEVPVFLRYTRNNRWFVDARISGSTHKLGSVGVTNYNNNFYVSKYGTYDEFVQHCQDDGMTATDSSDYLAYMAAARSDYEAKIWNTEQFKLFSGTINAGYYFFPHKSVKMYLGLGLTGKLKHKKSIYQHMDYNQAKIKDYYMLNQGFNKFGTSTGYYNIILGFEMYRFRLAAYFQNSIFYARSTGKTNYMVSNVNYFSPYDKVYSYGFSLATNLFTKEWGKNVRHEKEDGMFDGEEVVAHVAKKK